MVQSKISWDIIYDETVDVEEKYFKCKVDNNNKINVFIQNSFDLEYNSASVQIFKCAKLFHSNDYPILIIETKNGGGDPKLSLLIIQLFQIREVERTYTSYRLSDFSKKFYQKYKISYVNPETCSTINAFKELEEQIDYYNYDGLNIEHKRTKPIIELFSNSEREALNNFRKEYINLQNLKSLQI